MNNQNMSEKEIIQAMVDNPKIRRAVTKRSFYMFFIFYFGQYMEYPVADFQREMMTLAENKNIQNIIIAGFRNSAKSTILSLAFVIWSVLGEHQIKHVLLASKTEPKAQTLLQHIKDMLGPDSLLKKDLGPFREYKSPWNISSIVLSKYDAKISAVSTEQQVRGIRHGRYRPQLIILDDIEDIESVRTQESRDKMHEWLTREIIPAGDMHTRLIFIGNHLHNDSVMMRLKQAIKSGEMTGECRTYPAIVDGAPLWLGKYKDVAAVEAEKQRGLTKRAYRREFLLEIIPEGSAIVEQKDIKLYKFGEKFEGYRFSIIAIDPASRTKQENDCTAIVAADVYGSGIDLKIRIRPYPVNERLEYERTIDRVLLLSQVIGGKPRVFIEGNGFQEMFTILFRDKGVTAEAIQTGSKSKDERFEVSAEYIKNGRVEFAEIGTEELTRQMLYFGSEKHDDLVDALSLLISQAVRVAEQTSGFLQMVQEDNRKRNDIKSTDQLPYSINWVLAAQRGYI